MFTLGIDLAAEAKGTALTQILWSKDQAEIVQLQLGVEDEVIVEYSLDSEKIGIDCALGWPTDFVQFLNAHSVNDPEVNPRGDIDWRRRLSFRETDRQVRAITGRWPLSVATDRLGVTALRCAGLQAKLRQAGISIDRSGLGRVVEIYPGASLRLWGFDTAGYRTEQSARSRLLSELESQVPWLKLGEFRPLLESSTDAFDSLVACLATRAAALGLATLPEPEQSEKAREEGWIALPKGNLSDLL
jgi:hypothetical protein